MTLTLVSVSEAPARFLFLKKITFSGETIKPDFSMPGIEATEPIEQRAEAERWCDRFEANTRKWLKSTIGVHGNDGHPVITYEDVDTTLIPPRPRLYGLVGGEVIEQVWKERTEKATEAATVG